MGEGKRQMFQGPCSDQYANPEKEHPWIAMEGDDCDANNPTSSTSSINEDSTISNGSSSSFDTTDDASSSTSYSSSAYSSGPLNDLSDLMSQLPIKRGLSKYYQGKSQSFTCLSRVRSIEDLPKKESPYRKKMKACKSYEGSLDTYKSYTLPKPIISKKTARGLFSPSSFPGRKGSFVSSCRPPLIPAQKNLGC